MNTVAKTVNMVLEQQLELLTPEERARLDYIKASKAVAELLAGRTVTLQEYKRLLAEYNRLGIKLRTLR